MFIKFLFTVSMLFIIPLLAYAFSFLLSKLSLCLNINTVEILRISSVMAFILLALSLSIIALNQIYNIVLVSIPNLILSLV